MNRMRRLHAALARVAYVAGETFWARLSRRPGLRILFSVQDEWEAPIRRGFRFTQHKITFKELTDENIIAHDLVVPLSVDALESLTTRRHLVADNLIPIPSAESIAICNDKARFNQFLIENGFAEYIPRMGRPSTYPYILKKRVDRWGEHSHMISSHTEERAYLGTLDDPEYFCQEVIPGRNEYATHLVRKDGRLTCALSVEYTFEHEIPIKGKEFAYTAMCSSPYLDLFGEILDVIDFEGLCCVNYKVVGNHPYVLEINPRFGGSLGRFFFSFVRYVTP